MKKILKDIALSSSVGGLVSAVAGPFLDRGHSVINMVSAAFIAGFTIVALMLCYERFIKNTFLKKLPFLSILAISTVVDIAIIYCAMIIIFSEMGFQEDTTNTLEMIHRQDFIFGIILFSILIVIIQFISLLNRLIGQGVLFRILTGKYHRPVEREYFLMFLDMKSSTAIAEKIGHLRFLSLLNDFFYDLSIGVERTGGVIYKYVGDEAIVVWPKKKGVHRANCLRCFFILRNRVASRKEFYLKQYGLTPAFKAALHFGKVAIGEMGNFKQEIAYIGDAVNTTARIEQACNQLNRSFIASGEAMALLTLPQDMQAEILGKVTLRGRATKTALIALDAPENSDNRSL